MQRTDKWVTVTDGHGGRFARRLYFDRRGRPVVRVSYGLVGDKAMRHMRMHPQDWKSNMRLQKPF